jgi:ParB family chromosome partitioning protein
MTRKALGRGLKALIPESKAPEGGTLLQLDVERILPGRSQPRHDFDEGAITELAMSIKARGILQPVVVMPGAGDTYELIAGERRWRAAREAGLKSVPALVRTAGEAEALEMALIENLQREDLNPVEAAKAYRRLIDTCDITQEEVASRVGKERSSVANHLRLLKLPAEILADLSRGALTMGHARAILSVHGKEKQILAAKTIMSRGLSVREAEQLTRKLAGAAPRKKARVAKKDIFIKELEGSLRRSLGTRVSIRPGGKGGTIAISYYSPDELDRLAERLKEGS